MRRYNASDTPVDNAGGDGMAEFKDRLREERTSQGWSQEELAKRTGVSRTTVTNWESGHRSPELGHVEELSRLFDVSVDYLLGRTDDRHGTAVVLLREGTDENQVYEAVRRYLTSESPQSPTTFSTATGSGKTASISYGLIKRLADQGVRTVVILDDLDALPSARIRKLREEANWSVSDLGREVGQPDDVIEAWETGEHLPAPQDLHELTMVFGVTADYILGRVSEPTAQRRHDISSEWIEVIDEATSRGLTPAQVLSAIRFVSSLQTK
jgi:transcriptional regulator with XRE-family HTH domain